MLEINAQVLFMDYQLQTNILNLECIKIFWLWVVKFILVVLINLQEEDQSL